MKVGDIILGTNHLEYGYIELMLVDILSDGVEFKYVVQSNVCSEWIYYCKYCKDI